MNVQTMLNFYGQTEEAVKFYCRTIEAETLFMMRFRDRLRAVTCFSLGNKPRHCCRARL
jgi:uncharacterized glyoxalase superfamily protein PhnB